MRQRTLYGGVAIAAALALLAGCGFPAPRPPRANDPQNDVTVVYVDVKGERVPCVVYHPASGGGISCNFTPTNLD